jgi:hypothetical protein
MWHPATRGRAAELDALLQSLEQRLSRLTRTVRASRTIPAAVDRGGDTFLAALNDVAERFRGRARAVGDDAAHLSDEAWQFGNDAVRKLTREVEQRPLLTLAIAVGVGALAAGILTRRS